MRGKRIGRFLAIPVALAVALTLATTACTPAQAEALQGILQNVNSANGTITLVTKDGKTVTLNITSDTEAVNGDNNTVINISALKPGTEIEVETKDRGKSAQHIKAHQEQEDQNEGSENENEGSENETSHNSANWGIVEIRVTDPPAANVTSAIVTFSKIEVHKVSGNETEENESENETDSSGNTTSDNHTKGPENGGWITITTNVSSFDLMSIIGVEQILGSANLTAGKYTQIRMTVTNVTGLTTDNKSYTAVVPSGELKIVGVFNVGGGNNTTLTLDFDGAKSLIQAGDKFLFKPVVKLLIDHP